MPDPSTLPDLKTKLLDILIERSVRRGEFTLASGAKSDLYVNCKLTALDPAAALLVGAVGWELLKETAEKHDTRVNAVGGLTMGADPIALSIGIAAQLEDPGTALQTFTVRKAAGKSVMITSARLVISSACTVAGAVTGFSVAFLR